MVFANTNINTQRQNVEIGVERFWKGQPASAKRCERALQGVKDGTIRFIYCTVEQMLQTPNMHDLLLHLVDDGCLKRIVIDEHDYTQSAHPEFRGVWLQLDKIRERYPGVPITASSAVGTPASIVELVSGFARHLTCLYKPFVPSTPDGHGRTGAPDAVRDDGRAEPVPS